jgi:hypothetical protein
MTQAACNIAIDSKQSLTRRAALTGAVAVAVPFAAFSLIAPDPAYAAIEAYRTGCAHHRVCIHKADAIEEAIFEKQREFDANLDPPGDGYEKEFDKLLSSIQETQPSVTPEQLIGILRWKGHEIIREENGGPEMDRLGEEGSAAECDARDALFATVPTTAAGAAAMLAMIRAEIAAGTSMAYIFEDDEADKLFLSLETCLRALAVQS